MKKQLSRRDSLKLGAAGVVGTTSATAMHQTTKQDHSRPSAPAMQGMDHGNGFIPGTGDVDHEKNGFNPGDILTNFDYGKMSTLPDGRILLEY